MGRPILSLDFDGVIHSYTSKWVAPDVIPDPPVPGAMLFLREATKHFRVCIYSTRSATAAGRKAMSDWVWKWGEASSDWEPNFSPGDEPHVRNTLWLHKIEFPETKPPALVGIDDRVLTFEGEWPTMERLLTFKPWNKRPVTPAPDEGDG